MRNAACDDGEDTEGSHCAMGLMRGGPRVHACACEPGSPLGFGLEIH